jgi:hypothetical protein
MEVHTLRTDAGTTEYDVRKPANVELYTKWSYVITVHYVIASAYFANVSIILLT